MDKLANQSIMYASNENEIQEVREGRHRVGGVWDQVGVEVGDVRVKIINEPSSEWKEMKPQKPSHFHPLSQSREY